jgi:hypothetical protein
MPWPDRIQHLRHRDRICPIPRPAGRIVPRADPRRELAAEPLFEAVDAPHRIALVGHVQRAPIAARSWLWLALYDPVTIQPDK